MKKGILERFSEHGTLIQPDALEHITKKPDPDDYTSAYIEKQPQLPLILTLDHLKNYDLTIENSSITEQPVMIPEQPEEILSIQKDPPNQSTLSPQSHQIKEEIQEIQKVQSWKPLAREYEADYRSIKDITGKSLCQGKTKDFAKLFKHRFYHLRDILKKQRRELAHSVPLNRINADLKEIQVIGIVSDKRTTKNDHIRIDLEDETTTLSMMALKDQPAYLLAKEVMLDEIIGINATLSKNSDLLIINNIIFPDIKMHHEKNTSPDPLCAAFASDIHIGSDAFLTDQWNNFIKWLNGDLGNKRQRDMASRIKYVIFPGDVVDGIGIYPGQEDDLTIPDLYDQYKEFSRQLDRIPDHIALILQPGNHDAVRPAEPQPTFAKEIRDLFSGHDYKFIGNPSSFTIHNVEILSYHGVSLLDYATNIQGLNYNDPTPIMKMMLRKRHLTPTYGGYTPLAPEYEDYMIIDRSPDIFVTGHVHITSVDNYRGVTLINASAWQSQTEYQKMMNFVPDPAKVPIVNLKNGTPTVMDFSRPM